MVRVLMVCLGNICRSPLAEGILREKLKNKSVDSLVDSAGTSQWHIGENPDKRSIEVAAKNDIDISFQRARSFSPSDFNAFDLIFAMDQENYADIIVQAKSDEERRKVHIFLNYAGLGNKPVPDPYFGGDKGFEKIFKMLDEASDLVTARIIKEHI